MSETEIIKKVRDILNEHVPDGAVSLDGITEDRVLLEDYIKSAIPDAVVMLAQKGYAVNVHELEDLEDGKYCAIPADFISLIEVKLDTWRRAVNTVHSVGSPGYIMAQNEFTQPGPNTPICWKEHDRLFFLPPGESFGIGMYNAAYDTEEGINAEPKEATAVCYMTAALVLGMFGDDNGKQRLSDVATNMLQ